MKCPSREVGGVGTLGIADVWVNVSFVAGRSPITSIPNVKEREFWESFFGYVLAACQLVEGNHSIDVISSKVGYWQSCASKESSPWSACVR